MRRTRVTDASVLVDLPGRFAAELIEAALLEGGGKLVAPELLDIDMLHTSRRLETTEAIPASRRAGVLAGFGALPIRRSRHAALWRDIWPPRKILTAHDACDVALARQLEATLVTRDERFARARRGYRGRGGVSSRQPVLDRALERAAAPAGTALARGAASGRKTRAGTSALVDSPEAAALVWSHGRRMPGEGGVGRCRREASRR